MFAISLEFFERLNTPSRFQRFDGFFVQDTRIQLRNFAQMMPLSKSCQCHAKLIEFLLISLFTFIRQMWVVCVKLVTLVAQNVVCIWSVTVVHLKYSRDRLLLAYFRIKRVQELLQFRLFKIQFWIPTLSCPFFFPFDP